MDCFHKAIMGPPHYEYDSVLGPDNYESQRGQECPGPAFADS